MRRSKSGRSTRVKNTLAQLRQSPPGGGDVFRVTLWRRSTDELGQGPLRLFAMTGARFDSGDVEEGVVLTWIDWGSSRCVRMIFDRRKRISLPSEMTNAANRFAAS